MKRLLGLLFLLLIYWMLVGCGPQPEELAATIESEVETAVLATVSFIPTHTPNPTYTPYPTQTSLPTHTPNATYTPLHTHTPLPSYTPLPTQTFTPIPTHTPTITPTNTPLPLPTLPPFTPTPSGGLALLLRNEIDQTLQDMGFFRATISNFSGDWQSYRLDPIDCQENLLAYDRVTSKLNFDVIGSDTIIQNAYADYGIAIDQFVQLLGGWAEGCRQALADGETHREMGDGQRAEVWRNLDDIENILSHASNRLRDFIEGG